MIGRRRLLAGMLLPAGVIVSHSFGYVAAGADRHAQGHAAGILHGDLTGVVAIAAAAVAAVLLLEARASHAGSAPSPTLFRVLAVAQGAAYALMEIGERAADGIPVAEALGEPTLRWGLLIQTCVAACACLLVRVTRVVARAFRRRDGMPPVAAPETRWSSRVPQHWFSLRATPWSGRAPPAPFPTL